MLSTMLVIRMVIPWENWGPSFKKKPGRISCVAEPIDLDVCLSLSYLDYKNAFFEIPTERYENEDYNHTDSIHASILDQSSL